MFPPLKQPRPRKRQQESANQRMFVKALTSTGLGFFYRVKNMGTFDAKRGIYRKDYGTALVAIPDICGYRKDGKAIYIEVKYVQKVEQKRKLVFACRITDDQKEFLKRAHESGCLSGIAFTLEDCLAIAHDDPLRYPRHPRTWMFMPQAFQDVKIAEWGETKKALSRLKQDPVAAATLLAHHSIPGKD
jgi:hypothetical protein